ncbi:MAG TPA: hypothetical protein VLJ57_08560 [Burkholderiaceae bacterium]|nr:hypothetical protein [Burkholderiaceae bacterium]
MNDTVTIRMPIYRSGQTVQHHGYSARVSHVLLRRGELFVYLEGRENPVDPSELALEPTEFVYRRKSE